jgi:hypothetical protein
VGWALLAEFLHCEYQLYRANIQTPLRYNPWLSHWVEVVQTEQTKFNISSSNGQASQSSPTLDEIRKTRAEFVKTILEDYSSLQEEHRTPAALFQELGSSPSKLFDLAPYIHMLEEEGIYEPFNNSIKESSTAPSRDENKVSLQQDSIPSRADLLVALKDDHLAALDQLTALPINLKSLELINSLLFSGALDDYDPPILMHNFIQQALRKIESRDTVTTNQDIAMTPASMNVDLDEQARAVKLLVLFMRNLISRNVVNPQAIFFEIQEICVRFIWVKEVRDFRNELESGGQ